MEQEVVQEVLIDKTINFNGPEDDDDFDDDFEIEGLDSIEDFEDFDQDDF